jgi:hypothetical protein
MFAISNLGGPSISLNPVSRIQLARKYDIANWEETALTELCEREEPITIEEASLLGLTAFVAISSAREKERWERGLERGRSGDAEEDERAEIVQLQARPRGQVEHSVRERLKLIRDQQVKCETDIGGIKELLEEILFCSHDHHDSVMGQLKIIKNMVSFAVYILFYSWSSP